MFDARKRTTETAAMRRWGLQSPHSGSVMMLALG